METLMRVMVLAIVLMCGTHVEGSIVYRNDTHRFAMPALERMKAKADSLCYDNPQEAHKLYINIAEAYNDRMNDQEKRLCATAYNNAGYLQFFIFKDFLAAWMDFSDGIEIAKKIEDKSLLGTLHLNIGNVYANFEDSNLAMAHYTQSASYFYDEKDWDRFQVPMFNMMLTGFNTERSDSVTVLVKHMIEESPKGNGLQNVNDNFAKAYMASLNNNLNEAELYLQQALDSSNCMDDSQRYSSQILTLIGGICLEQGNSAKAVERFRQIDQMLMGSNETDLIGFNYQNLANAYKALSNVDSANYYRLKSFEITDSILTLNRLNEIRNAEARVVMERNNKEIKQQIEQRRRLTMILIITCIVVIIVSILLGWIWHNYRALKQKNMVLYKKIQSEINAATPSLAENSSPSDEESEEEKQERYSYSNLTNQDKEQIYREISGVMECDDIFNPKFSIAMLADQIGRSKRQVSQVINETTGKNFSVLLAEYRIREACRRLSNPKKFGHLTLETIGHDLGFLSRSNFSTTFKKITGMTPRDYIKCTPAQ